MLPKICFSWPLTFDYKSVRSKVGEDGLNADRALIRQSRRILAFGDGSPVIEPIEEIKNEIARTLEAFKWDFKVG